MNLNEPRRVHFIGVGGVGMSAIAKVLIERGHSVSGSDLKRSRAATLLEAIGATIRIGHSAEFLAAQDPDLVVVSTAIPETNAELKLARDKGIEVMGRGETLAAVLEGHKSIVVAGTHGKTTTTSMIVSILRKAEIDATYLVGGGLNDVGTNARSGKSPWAVAESDESDGSFLLLSPTIAIVTNVEIDHLDYWETPERMRAGFTHFLGRVNEDGVIVVPRAEQELVEAAEKCGRGMLTFGTDGEIQATNIRSVEEKTTFDIEYDGKSESVSLRVPGTHNVLNALAAAGGALQAGVPLATIAQGLSDYRGVERRFQVRGRAQGVTVVDDYAHLPTEINVTLAAARTGSWRRVVAVFQPHRYSRTRAFHADFGKSFIDADRIVVTDVYGAGEQAIPGVSGKLIADSICTQLPGRPVAYIPHRSELAGYLEKTLRSGDVVLTLGAGDISALGEEILDRLGSES
jgi:UDP-N-acetylmuramate--alanine ligase